MLIIYHANCQDGWCCAWLLKKKFPDAVYLPMNYGEEPPNCEGQDVIIADFSFKSQAMLKIIKNCNSLLVLDHHKTAEKELAGLAESFGIDKSITIRFEKDKCGARMVSEYFGIESWLVDYVEDRDLWKWKLEDGREINAAIELEPFEVEAWDRLESTMPMDLFFDGQTVLKYQQKCVDVQVKNAIPVEIDGAIVPCINCTHLVSEIVGELSRGKAFAAGWFRREDEYVFSLRSDSEGVDVSLVAAKYGGGGHHHAAGFKVKDLWF